MYEARRFKKQRALGSALVEALFLGAPAMLFCLLEVTVLPSSTWGSYLFKMVKHINIKWDLPWTIKLANAIANKMLRYIGTAAIYNATWGRCFTLKQYTTFRPVLRSEHEYNWTVPQPRIMIALRSGWSFLAPHAAREQDGSLVHNKLRLIP